MKYEIYQTEEFEKKLKSLDKSVREQIDKKIKFLANNPYGGAGNVGHLKGEFKGLRRIRVGRSWRIIFAICEECRKLGYKDLRKCVDCENISDKSVKLFDIWKK